jgi:hypothetical protein
MCEFFQSAPLKISGRLEKAYGARARRPAFIENTLKPTRIGWWILYMYFCANLTPSLFYDEGYLFWKMNVDKPTILDDKN